MEAGDRITIRFQIHALPAVVLDVEKYRDAYILYYRFTLTNQLAYGCVFPEIPLLPGGSYFVQELFTVHAWCEWKDSIFIMPIRLRSRPLPNALDMRAVMRRRITFAVPPT